MHAELGRNFAGRVIPSIASSQLALVLKEPLGVVGAIVPWNRRSLAASKALLHANRSVLNLLAPTATEPGSSLTTLKASSDSSIGTVHRPRQRPEVVRKWETRKRDSRPKLRPATAMLPNR